MRGKEKKIEEEKLVSRQALGEKGRGVVLDGGRVEEVRWRWRWKRVVHLPLTYLR